MHRRRFFAALLAAPVAALAANHEPVTRTVTIQTVNIESDDPDRFAFGLVEAFKKADGRKLGPSFPKG